MATDQDQLVLAISADTTSIRNSLKKLVSDSKSATDGIRKNFEAAGRASNDNLAKGFNTTSKSMINDAQNLRYQLNDVFATVASGGSVLRALGQQGTQISQSFGSRGISGAIKLTTTALVGMVSPINLALAAFGIATYAAEKYFGEVDDGSAEAKKAIDAQRQALDAVVQEWGDLLPALKAVRDAQKEVADQQAIKSTTAQAIADTYAPLKESLAGVAGELRNINSSLMATGNAPQAKALGESYRSLRDSLNDGTASAEQLNKLIAALEASITDANRSAVLPLIDSLKAQAGAFDQARASAQTFTDQEKRATEAQKQLNSAIAEMSKIAQLPISDMEKLIRLYDDAIGKALQLDNAEARSEAGRAALAAFRAGSERIENTQSGGTAAKNSLVDRAANAKIAARISQLDDTFAERLNVLLAEFPGAKIQSAFRTFAEQAAIYDSGVRPAARPGNSLHEKGRAADLSGVAPSDYARLHARAKELGINFDVKNDPLHAQLTDATAASKKAESALTDWMAKQREAIDLQKQANAIRGDSSLTIDQQSAAIEENKLFQEGLNSAIEQYGTVSDAQRAQIRATAHEYAQLGLAADQMAERTKAAAEAQKEHQAELADFAKAITGVAKNAVTGFVSDMRNGASAGEAFRNSLSRVADGLLNLAIESLFSEKALGGVIQRFIMGFGGGGQAGIARSGGIGLYHGGGIVGSPASSRTGVSPLAFATAPRMHSGGIAGLHAGEVPAILQRGEMVVPALQAGRAQSGNVSLGDVNIDMSASGYVAADTASGKAWGENMRKIIQVEMVRQSRPGGILRKAPGT
jgi:hypothetical protein